MPMLNERDRRLAMAVEARTWGHGEISAVSRATGSARATISRGLKELDEEPKGTARVRAPGGGRKKAEAAGPGLVETLEGLVEPESRGHPESPLRWTTMSTRRLAGTLAAMGHEISHSAVAAALRGQGFSLQQTFKTLEGSQHADRDAQFRHINDTAAAFLAAGDPVISIDTKRKTTHLL